MLHTNELPRVFIHTDENGQQIKLADPDNSLSPEAVLNFYANTYPVLTTAKIDGPEFKEDELQYRFVSTIGIKG